MFFFEISAYVSLLRLHVPEIRIILSQLSDIIVRAICSVRFFYGMRLSGCGHLICATKNW